MPADRKMVHAIEKALTEDERTSGLTSVHINAVSGVVFLEGSIGSPQQRDTVVEIVKKVEGVRLVREKLQIDPDRTAGGWREAHHHEDPSSTR